jgi:ABC-type uncharacterized transport system ATPase subunit
MRGRNVVTARRGSLADRRRGIQLRSHSSQPVLETAVLPPPFGRIEVLSDVSIGVRAGEVHAIVGENGAGQRC